MKKEGNLRESLDFRPYNQASFVERSKLRINNFLYLYKVLSLCSRVKLETVGPIGLLGLSVSLYSSFFTPL